MKFCYLIPLLLFAACSSTHEISPDWNDSVVYEIFVRSFYDSDGDGTGDLKGVEMKLDYIQDLGANAIWLMPIFQSPSDHGYDVTDYYQIEEDYGTMEDFHSLMDACDARGIRVILDLVLNHTSSHHPWFLQSIQKVIPYDDYYIWRDSPPGGRWLVYNQDSTIENGGWRFRHERAAYFYAYFTEKMPDLNLENPHVRKEVKKIAEFWLDQGVDGFRLDAAQNAIEEGPGRRLQYDSPSTVAWWTEFSQFVKSVNPHAMLVGEIWAEPHDLARYYAGGKGLDRCFSFPFQRNVLESLKNASSGPVLSAIPAIAVQDAPFTYFAPFLSNHDQERYMTTLGKDFRKAKLAAVLLFTAPGTPFIYYGEEIGMHQGAFDHSTTRTPMQWNNDPATAGFTSGPDLWASPGYHLDPFNVEAQQKSDTSLLNLYRELISIRMETPALRYGSYEFYPADQGILAFDRLFEDQKILVVINLTPDQQQFRIPEQPGEYRSLPDHKILIPTEGIPLDPYAYLILEPVLY